MLADGTQRCHICEPVHSALESRDVESRAVGAGQDAEEARDSGMLRELREGLQEDDDGGVEHETEEQGYEKEGGNGIADGKLWMRRTHHEMVQQPPWSRHWFACSWFSKKASCCPSMKLISLRGAA